jgi:pyridoxal phosphate enzyme (YggS family)
MFNSQRQRMNKLIEENYRLIVERIAKAAHMAGREPGSVKLVVVTKSQPLEAVARVVAAGALCLGENYLEEALEKIEALAGKGVEWRMIGHVQSRKAREVAENFAWCDAVDSLKLAVRLDRFAGEAGRTLAVLLECNVSGEESKFGYPAWDETHWPDLVGEFSQVAALPNLQVRGLMTMPPFFDEPERVRPFFRRLARLQAFLSQRLPQASWQELSMGMSGDFEAAIQEGATLVRIGTAIMGPRY